MSNTSIRLIVGLGNIGDAYKGTRHNAGFHFVDEVANEYRGTISGGSENFLVMLQRLGSEGWKSSF